MALVVNSVKHSSVGQKVISLTADDDYVTGGYPFDLGVIAGMRNVAFVSLENEGGWDVFYDRANKKLKFFVDGGAQVASSGDLSTLVDARLLVIGT